MLLHNFILLFQEGLFDGPGNPDSYMTYTIGIILVMIALFVLGYLIRMLIGAQYKRQVKELTADLESCRAKSNQLEQDLSSARYDLSKNQDELKRVRNQNANLDIKLKVCNEKLNSIDPAVLTAAGIDVSDTKPTDKSKSTSPASAKKSDMAMKLGSAKQDDLKIIEGIGPKIAELLIADGIDTWQKLADASVERLKEILAKAGERFRLAVPDTWPQQAQLAVDGKWKELQELQDRLDGGRVV